MKTVLCTLYNSLYLDKGLVLYDSLCECAEDFKLYVLCMDDKCYEVLTDLHQEHHIPVRLTDFEDDVMLEAKANRSFGEYCWTCSASFILYILETYNEPICTYVDADMYFFQDPKILIDEMREAGKTVMITPHRFSIHQQHMIMNGIYCVEFNTFVNEEGSLGVLRKWKQDCIECCTAINDGVHLGDQKYLDTWPHDYPEIVHVCQNFGAGIAPWNIEWYTKCNDEEHFVYYNNNEKPIPIVFYHFQHVTYIDRKNVDTGVLSGLSYIDYSLVEKLYVEYLTRTEMKKQMLEQRYDIISLIKKHPTESNYNWKFWLMQYRIGKWLRILVSPIRPIKHFYIVSVDV